MSFCTVLPAVFQVVSILFAQDVPQITREGNEWVRTDKGVAAGAMTRVLKISTRGHLIVRGSTAEQLTYRLTERVRARNSDDAHRLFGSTVINSKQESAMTVFSVMPMAQPIVLTELEIGVPKRFATVILDVRPGDIEAYDIDGNLRAETAAGQIRCDRIAGMFEGRTGGGEIHLGKIGGAIRCSNGAGSIIVDNAGSSANCQTAGGEIQIKEAVGALVLSTEGGNIQVDQAGANIEAHTGEGVIEVGQCKGMVFADTKGGSIQIGAARGVRCSTGAGPVRVKSSSGPMQVQTALGSILAELVAGARVEDSSLVAGSGDIRVLIPSNVSLSVLARNDSGANPKIVSDFSEVRARSIAPRAPVALTNAVVYQGAINGGGPLLTLSTASGIIYVKKTK